MNTSAGWPLYASVVFDADSTLSTIEGIDWLGAQRGDEVGHAIKTLTDRAMSGELALEFVYGARLEVIKPTLDEIEALGRAYVATAVPGAAFLIAELQAKGVRVVVVSGGLRAALLPLAATLGIAERDVYAVDLVHDGDGNYVSLAPQQLLSLQDGKPRVVRALGLRRPSVMIGDGATDAAVRDDADMFIAYTGVARRPSVVAVAGAEARNFAELREVLFSAGGVRG